MPREYPDWMYAYPDERNEIIERQAEAIKALQAESLRLRGAIYKELYDELVSVGWRPPAKGRGKRKQPRGRRVAKRGRGQKVRNRADAKG